MVYHVLKLKFIVVYRCSDTYCYHINVNFLAETFDFIATISYYS